MVKLSYSFPTNFKNTILIAFDRIMIKSFRNKDMLHKRNSTIANKHIGVV